MPVDFGVWFVLGCVVISCSAWLAGWVWVMQILLSDIADQSAPRQVAGSSPPNLTYDGWPAYLFYSR